jgi:hypothetical protein
MRTGLSSVCVQANGSSGRSARPSSLCQILSYDSEGIMSSGGQMKMCSLKTCVWDLGEVKIALASGSKWGDRGLCRYNGRRLAEPAELPKSEKRNYITTFGRATPTSDSSSRKRRITSIGGHESTGGDEIWKHRWGIEESLLQQTKTSQLITLPKQYTEKGGIKTLNPGFCDEEGRLTCI